MLADRVLDVVAEPVIPTPSSSSYAGLSIPSSRSLDELFAEADTPSPEAGPSTDVMSEAAGLSGGSVSGAEEEHSEVEQLKANVAELVRRTVAMEEALRTMRGALSEYLTEIENSE